jgi:small nuclear ribonucleoprotein (snRNP)-like protein
MGMWTRWPIFDRVLVNLTDGSAIDGVLIDKRGPLLVLADATLLVNEHEPAAMDGQVFVERSNVLFLQASKPKGG